MRFLLIPLLALSSITSAVACVHERPERHERPDRIERPSPYNPKPPKPFLAVIDRGEDAHEDRCCSPSRARFLRDHDRHGDDLRRNPRREDRCYPPSRTRWLRDRTHLERSVHVEPGLPGEQKPQPRHPGYTIQRLVPLI